MRHIATPPPLQSLAGGRLAKCTFVVNYTLSRPKWPFGARYILVRTCTLRAFAPADIQGVSEFLERFCKAKSQEPLGLQKRHRCQKMRLILKFCLENLNY
jgi:hypothetical protein